MKVEAFRCNKCGAVHTERQNVFGIHKTRTLFDDAATCYPFESVNLEKCEIHACIDCMKDAIDNPIAYLKGKDRKAWEIKRLELSYLFRKNLVEGIANVK